MMNVYILNGELEVLDYQIFCHIFRNSRNDACCFLNWTIYLSREGFVYDSCLSHFSNCGVLNENDPKLSFSKRTI